MTIERARYYRNINEAQVTPKRTGHHTRRFDTFRSLLPARENMRVFNFGCGSGELAAILAAEGHRVTGADASADMIELAIGNAPHCEFIVGGVGDMPDGPWDVIAAFDILPYLAEADETTFFENAARTLPSGGALVFSHANMLVDLVTFNRYTVEFWRDQIIPSVTADASQRAGLLDALRSHLAHPDEPRPSAGHASERDRLPKRRINPLAYPARLAQFGFRVDASAYTHYYPMPPQWMETNHPDLILAFEDAFKENALSAIFASIVMMRVVRE